MEKTLSWDSTLRVYVPSDKASKKKNEEQQAKATSSNKVVKTSSRIQLGTLRQPGGGSSWALFPWLSFQPLSLCRQFNTMGQTKAAFVGNDFPPRSSQGHGVFIPGIFFSLFPLLTELGDQPILRQEALENTLRQKHLALTLEDNPVT